MSILPAIDTKPRPHREALPPLFDLKKIREDFPILNRTINGHPLVYFDNAATTQKPRGVIEAVGRFYEHYNANVHRAGHLLSQLASGEYEEARVEVQRFLHCAAAEGSK